MAPEIDELIRSRRRTIALIVDQHGKLIVRAPLLAPLSIIHKFVAGKQGWIEKHRQTLAARPQPKPLEYKDGERFLLRGKPTPLRILPGLTQAISLTPDGIHLKASQQGKAASLIEQLYKRIARQHFSERLTTLANALQYRFTAFRLSSASTRWGSCSSRGTISLTWRLIMAPDDVIDYVIVHELVHLKVHNHSQQFWQTVEQHMPDYKKKKDWLKKNSHLMHIK